MKKIISSVLLVAMLLALCLGAMTGCTKPGSKAVEFEMPEGGFDTTKEVEITFYHSMGAALQEILNTAIADFNEIYPNIKITHKSYGDYDGVRDQIKTEITVGGQPNLAYCYPDHVALYNVAGAVQTLDVLIESEYGYTQEQIDDFIPAYYNEGKAFGDGKMYSLPIAKSTEVLYYNKTFFEKHGLTVPTTWDEMEETCRKIKELEPTCIPLGYDSEANWFITMCEQYGSDYTSASGENFLFDNETNHNFIKRFRTWYQNKWVTTEALSGGYTSALFTGESSGGDTVSTRCYMCIGSSGGATYQQPNQTNGVFEFEVGITSIPQIDVENPKVISQGPSICIFKNEDPQEVLATWLFAKFLTTDVVFQGSISMNNGYVPVIKSVEDNPVYAEFLQTASTANIQAYVVKVGLEQADAYYVSPAFNGSSVARDQVGLLVQKCLVIEGSDVDAAIKKAFKEAVEECKYQSGQ
ncbi:MAG: extracellular solute-binding protein [Oscillospiraceae bacterium]|nr:extracellular solute-binding protein [Oscillospiraceae bacterium]